MSEKTKRGLGGVVALAAVVGAAGFVMKNVGDDADVIRLHATWTSVVPTHLSYIVSGGPNEIITRDQLKSMTVNGVGDWSLHITYHRDQHYSVSIQPGEGGTATCDVRVNGVEHVNLSSDRSDLALVCAPVPGKI